ncbi:hypothetical protein BJY04DRAFT_225062 [Aspergillus karnatakaensis]|uniref:uncharacterized protein n=1 Tax=Aspergillus karnatakaensis TaxID=1810916 RepID=UPI003CCCD9E8
MPGSLPPSLVSSHRAKNVVDRIASFIPRKGEPQDAEVFVRLRKAMKEASDKQLGAELGIILEQTIHYTDNSCYLPSEPAPEIRLAPGYEDQDITRIPVSFVMGVLNEAPYPSPQRSDRGRRPHPHRGTDDGFDQFYHGLDGKGAYAYPTHLKFNYATQTKDGKPRSGSGDRPVKLIMPEGILPGIPEVLSELFNPDLPKPA